MTALSLVLSAGVTAAKRAVAVTVAFSPQGFLSLAVIDRSGRAKFSAALADLECECGGVQAALVFLSTHARGCAFTRSAVAVLNGDLGDE